VTFDIPTIDPGALDKPLSISPTDVSQFIRLDQCQRYLRLRLHERLRGNRFLRDYDVAPQSIPPILSRSGAVFEASIEREAAARFPTTHFSADQRKAADTRNNNQDLCTVAASLEAGTTHVLFQARLQAPLGTWKLTGDVDVVRLERSHDGRLHILIADMKSSTASKVEHRLQVAFYHDMLQAILAEQEILHEPISLAIVYRGPAAEDDTADEAFLGGQRAAAERLLGTSTGYLEPIDDADAYVQSVHDLVTGPQSLAGRVLAAPFESIPFHLSYKCDGCLYNELCMKQAAEADDLSLLPHLNGQDKRALRRHQVVTIGALAHLKDIRRKGSVLADGEIQDRTALVPAPGEEQRVQDLATTWPVGPRLDELVHRARRYRNWKREDIDYLKHIPHRGYASVPYSGPDQNPNLVRVFIDVQHDYLVNRVYMLGALVIGNEGGSPNPARRRSIVELAAGPPAEPETEANLLQRWIARTLEAIVEIAAPDPEGKRRAPIHLFFINNFAQRTLLDALGRHMTSVFGTTAIFDFVTQIAAFDSALVTHLETEIRRGKNYPMLCQSLQSVAAFLRFDWNAGTPYRDLFRTRLFDYLGRFENSALPDDDPARIDWYTRRSRFNSQIPLEYVYAAWSELPLPEPDKTDEFADYRAATTELLTGFHARRLEAMEHVVSDFDGNRYTTLSIFDLPELETFTEKAGSLAEALLEFVVIERHVEMAEWKAARLAPPEQRVLSGSTLIVRYCEEDQDAGVAEANRDNRERVALTDTIMDAIRREKPNANKGAMSPDQKHATQWSQRGMTFRLRVETGEAGCSLDEALRLSTLRAPGRFILNPRLATDSRLPVNERVPYTPTAKSMLWGMRVELNRLVVDRDAEGKAVRAFAEISVPNQPSSGPWAQGFIFGGREEPFEQGTLYTIDDDINSYTGYWALKVAEGLVNGGENAMYAILDNQERPAPTWPEAAAKAQRRFLDGLDALDAAGALHDFEHGKRDFIGNHGGTPLLMVQGPPGTGKSYSTAFALFARLQGAMAAGIDFRILIACNTHSAIDVLVENLRTAKEKLEKESKEHPGIFAQYFDARLLGVPLFRFKPKGTVHPGITPVAAKETGKPNPIDILAASRWAIFAATPGGQYSLIKDQWGNKNLFGHGLAHCLVLDEASQMGMPDGILASLPLAQNGSVIVVGDHRQMPPIVSNDWATEPRRTFQEFKAYESLFESLLLKEPPKISFEESFRLHRDMAEFLRREIYVRDNINYHSNRVKVLPERTFGDSFLSAVLDPAHPIVVIIHEEADSQLENAFEQQLMVPLLATLVDPTLYGLGPRHGLGVVVPHRAQRAALQDGVHDLNEYDEATGDLLLSAVETVEKFQGDERDVIIYGATESDRDYLIVAGKFLYDPRRLTVALSRAKEKLILVASRSVFELFSTDEETFQNAQLWKNLLRHTCTVPLWEGERHGVNVQVWGNPPTEPATLHGDAP
jgi:hypothetical protein